MEAVDHRRVLRRLRGTAPREALGDEVDEQVEEQMDVLLPEGIPPDRVACLHLKVSSVHFDFVARDDIQRLPRRVDIRHQLVHVELVLNPVRLRRSNFIVDNVGEKLLHLVFQQSIVFYRLF